MKNTKVIIAVIAFTVTFVFSAGLVRLILPEQVVKYVYVTRPQFVERRSSNDIETFLLRDISNGDYKDSCYGTEKYPAAVMDYWKTSSGMNAEQFPQDFQAAWNKHMQAWRNYADYLAEVEKTSSREDRIKGNKLNKEINTTWYEVLRIGRTYGAYVNQ